MASATGLPALVARLDAVAKTGQGSPSLPQVLETIQLIAILHPGSVPDRDARLQAIKSSAPANSELARLAQRLEILQAYYTAASKGRAEQSAASLSDPVMAGWLPGLHARADAALRSGDYQSAEALAQQLIEADPFSPLLTDAHLILGLCSMYRGQSPAAEREFQRALALSPMPTVYGGTREFATLAYRFARPSPGVVGGLFNENTFTRFSGIQGLDDPQSLIFRDGQYFLADREQIYAVTPDGKATGSKVARRLNDMTAAGAGPLYHLAEDALDMGTGNWVRLSYTSAGKTRALGHLLSLAMDRRGDIYLLDQDAGLLRGTPGGGALSPAVVAPIKGRLLRIDGRDFLYVLMWDRRSISVLSRDGKTMASISPAPVGGRTPSIEYFAIDALNHVYILDTGTNAIHIFGLNSGSAALEAVPLVSLTLDQRPHNKNLRVLAVSSTGEIAVTGKNEDNWVIYR